uniref:hypothetical protein n=1 Tax=Caballeronia sp. ATUFL_F2_KS9A TaxID=2921777 RepID=UPI002541B93F
APAIKQNAEERRVITYEITPANPTPKTRPKLTQATVDSVKNHSQEIFVQCLYMLPVVGNAMSLYDVGMDIYRIVSQPGESKSFTAWGILAIDAIGVIPAAGNATVLVQLGVIAVVTRGNTRAQRADDFWPRVLLHRNPVGALGRNGPERVVIRL